jgi:crotonobetainyl-CoA:carnitine CoA-transferase CaiB-like acyl-CoA transferase
VSGVFDGLQVLDLSEGVAGPMTTMMLADNGASVTRVEHPDGSMLEDPTGQRVWNRGKRSIVLDLKSEDGRKTFLELASTADIIVETYAPGSTAELGIDHATLSAANPRLITCSISGYGDHPQHRDRPGIDALVSARTGLLYEQKGRRGTAMEFILGRKGPHPEFDAPAGLVRGADRPGPIFARTPWPSVGAAYFATLGISGALRARSVTGRGQLVSTSLLQGALAAVSLGWQRVENPDAPLYWMWPVDARSIEGLFECSDGQWVHHWGVIPSWVLASAEGDELATISLGGVYRDEPDRLSMEADGMLTGMFLYPTLAEAFKKFPAADWVRVGESAGVGLALVRSPAHAFADESFLADGCVVEVEDPEVGVIRHLGPLLEFSATPGAVRGPAPVRGQDTEAVVAEASRVRPKQHSRSESLAHPLEGVRVLDLGLGVAGPYTGRVLADLGAEVIKVNALHDTWWAGTHMALGTNRGKRSISLNLKHPAGRAVLERLIEGADVVTTNWRPGAAQRLGLDFESLHERYPRLVVCNTRGYEKGPRSQLPGTDQTAAALAGLEYEDGASHTGNPPIWSRANMGDVGNALLAAIAITAALYHREETGEAQAVSTSIVNASLLLTSYCWIHADGTPADYGHLDANQTGLSPLYGMYRCKDDRWIFVAALTEKARHHFFEVVGESEALLEDVDKAKAILEARFSQLGTGEWFEKLDPIVPVEIVDEFFCRSIFDDPESRSRLLVSETWAGNVGRFEDVGLLVNFSDTPSVVQRGPCMCGEHTRELMRELRYDDSEIDAMIAEDAVLDLPVNRT